MRASLIFVFAVAPGALGVTSARAGSLYNAYEGLPASLTGGSATSFTMVLKGDVRSTLNLTAMQTDTVANPFAYVNKNYFGGSGTSSVTATLDTNGNTVVTFTGTNPVLSTYNFSYGSSGNGLPHVGLDGTAGNLSLSIISQAWSNTSSSQATPALTVANPNPPGGSTSFVTFFATVTSGSQSTGQWFEVPYTTGTSPQLTLTNYTSSNETLSNVGYMLSPTLIPLDNLNFNTLPPPGMSGSPFTSLPGYDGSMLTGGDGKGGAGGTITTDALPEPASIVSFASGLVVVAGYLARQRIHARRGDRAIAA